jgi:hypothetical protein
MLKREAQVPLEEEYSKKTVRLKEEADDNHRGYSVTIRGLPEECIVFRADQFPAPRNLLGNSRGECKRSDFVIIAHTNHSNWIVISN